MSKLSHVETNAGTTGDGAREPASHEGRLVRTDGAGIAIESTLSSPPGSLVTFRLEGVSTPYKMKVRGCRKKDGAPFPFTVEGRFVDLTREQRDAIVNAAKSV